MMAVRKWKRSSTKFRALGIELKIWDADTEDVLFGYMSRARLLGWRFEIHRKCRRVAIVD
jgi:hypothetical protein